MADLFQLKKDFDFFDIKIPNRSKYYLSIKIFLN